jgi:cytochrome c biogenesis protein CcdA
MNLGSPVFALAAGVLSILSPCVLPILPIVLGSAAAKGKSGPPALAAGLAISFVVIGLLLATFGHWLGLDADRLRSVAAAIIIGLGAWLLIPAFQTRLAAIASPIANWADRYLPDASNGSVGGQFTTGLLLGAIWSPCVGPTLGAASLLAAQGRDLAQVALVMLFFGIGASLPLLALGMLSQNVLRAWRGRLFAASQGLKYALGSALVLVGLMAVAGIDKMIETELVNISPEWMTALSTRF